MFSLLTLLDDIATTLDDVAVMTKLAIEKTSVLMSDDLAVNANVLSGTKAHREIPVVKAIFWGSLLNKVYAISGVLILMAVYPPLLTVILFLGGLYLSFEGAHKVFDKLKKGQHQKVNQNLSEQQRIKGAVRTDLVLSIEIILIAKQSITGDYFQQVLALILVGLAASFIIYGLVACLVKIDDLGLVLINRGHQKLGLSLIKSMPYLMKVLGYIGTVAMFLVGGGIVNHVLHLSYIMPGILQDLVVGIFVGGLVLAGFEIILHLKSKK